MKTTKVDLMLELFMHVRKPDHSYSYQEIAAFCGCTWQNIWYGEQRALRKLKAAAKRSELI